MGHTGDSPEVWAANENTREVSCMRRVLNESLCCRFKYKSHKKRGAASSLDIFLLTVFGIEQALNNFNELMSERMRQIT